LVSHDIQGKERTKQLIFDVVFDQKITTMSWKKCLRRYASQRIEPGRETLINLDPKQAP
jgi:hypothetical protein